MCVCVYSVPMTSPPNLFPSFMLYMNVAISCYGKTSDEFAVTSGVGQGCVLALMLFSLYFDVVIQMVLENGQPKGRGVRVAYLHDAKLV